MAKKRRRRRVSLLTKVINIGVLALAFSPALQNILAGKPDQLLRGYSAGLVGPGGTGTFSKETALAWYGPIVAAIVLKKAISMVRKTVRV